MADEATRLRAELAGVDESIRKAERKLAAAKKSAASAKKVHAGLFDKTGATMAETKLDVESALGKELLSVLKHPREGSSYAMSLTTAQNVIHYQLAVREREARAPELELRLQKCAKEVQEKTDTLQPRIERRAEILAQLAPLEQDDDLSAKRGWLAVENSAHAMITPRAGAGVAQAVPPPLRGGGAEPPSRDDAGKRKRMCE